ncbi:MAG: alpha-glucan family phosphorylase [Clostridia bacterium]|nr:alpha-glucan family phosphorylase [Clostridia bacterium]
MSSSLLNTKRVLSICMETTAGGRNYSGGLGALYGDTTRTMDRLGASFMAVTPIYKNGYVRQSVTPNGVIDEYPMQNFEDDYTETGITFAVPLIGRELKVKIWRHKKLTNCFGVDTFLPENGEFANITNNLYGENGIGIYDGEAQRLMQEVILGVSAIKLCGEIGFDYEIIHLNEGHGVFAPMYVISQLMSTGMDFYTAWHCVRNITVFTTHTPILAGNKSRPINMIMDMGANLGLSRDEVRIIGSSDNNGEIFGSTVAALRLSKIANAVAFKHQETSHNLWNSMENICPIMYIDNGVDIEFWQDPAIKKAYEENSSDMIYEAHAKNKHKLVEEVQRRNGVKLDENSIIVGFARRVIAYKRADLIFEDLNRFEKLINEHNFQIIFSGKTHPKDYMSKEILMRLFNMTQRYPNNVVFLQNYDVEVAGLMTKGCDVWLGNPEIPLEACSTSGMKAAANGVINLSTADGWWYRSCRYSINGWTIGETVSHNKNIDAQYLYRALEERVLPAFEDRKRWTQMMLNSVYTAIEECSTDRMCRDYYRYLYNAPELFNIF